MFYEKCSFLFLKGVIIFLLGKNVPFLFKGEIVMDLSKKVRLLMAELNLTATKMAEMAGISQSNFSKKMKNNSFSIEDLEKIADAAGVKFEAHFLLENGERV